MTPPRAEWTDAKLTAAFEELNEKLDAIVDGQTDSRQEQHDAAERARRDWLTFFAPVAVALVGLLGTIITLILTKGTP